MFHLNVYVCTTCMPAACGGQNRVLDPRELELQMVGSKPLSGSLELNLGPLQEQRRLKAAGPSLPPRLQYSSMKGWFSFTHVETEGQGIDSPIK